MNARRARLQISYQNKDITADLQPDLLSWSYTDNLSGQADDLQIKVKDEDKRWIGPWMPDHGAELTGKIVREHWEQDGKVDALPIGKFEIDEVDISGPPSAATIKGISVPESSSLRGQEKYRAWEKVKLSVIAKDIAGKAKLRLIYQVDDDPEYDRVEQSGETDLAFLMRLCNDAGLCLKITGSDMVIFDEEEYEKKPAVATIRPEHVKSYQGKRTTQGLYRACRVVYHSSKGKKKIDYTFTPPNAPKTGRTLHVNQQVSSVKEAQRLAKKKLREANRNAVTFSLTMPGDTRFAAGITIDLAGFGKIDGKYIITRAVHSQSNGYEVQLDLRRCLEGY